MTCQDWAEKLDAYLDGELPAEEERAVREHLRGCVECAAESLDRLQMKRAVQTAGLRFKPDPAFRARIAQTVAAPTRRTWQWLPMLATVAAMLIAGGLLVSYDREQTRGRQLASELVDMHVATLASANPVDVISTDRHTVKPWFAGRIPFTFSLPELEGSPFVLVGGRVSYLRQAPGAELIFRVRQHQISVFIFQERAVEDAGGDLNAHNLSFGVRTWSKGGLRYFVIGDAGAADLDKLTELMKAAG